MTGRTVGVQPASRMDGSTLLEARQQGAAGKTVGEHRVNQWSSKAILMGQRVVKRLTARVVRFEFF